MIMLKNVKEKTNILVLVILCVNGLIAFGNDNTYVERQKAYVDIALQSNTGHKLTLQAYRGLPIDPAELDEILSDLPTKYNSDFQIVELVRVLFYSNGLYDDDILPVLAEIPFWLSAGDTIRNYWTENHMIMWMSSEWLLHERYDRPIDNTLYPRLIHYLELKLEFGFYEFFSSVYLPYTLSGLLNLYEFSEDSYVKELAMKAAQRLLQDLLKPATDKGVYFPAAGRNYPGKYTGAYGQNHSSLIYLLTGKGDVPTKASHAGAFLATSSLPVDEIINSWTPYLDTIVQVGHTVDNSFSIHQDMRPIDRLLFQWSTGAYLHPDVVQETFQVLTDSSLWSHKDWEPLRDFSKISPEIASNIVKGFGVLSNGSVISQHNVHIFKNNSVALMSIPDMWKGKIGSQQWPFAATVGTTAVFTQSGEVKLDWSERDPEIENTHLPHVEQNRNVALIMYRPEPIPELLNLFAGEKFENKEVALFWQENAYDEIVENEQWLMGRQNENYVAVRRSCTEMLNTWWACETGEGQTWVVMVGDSMMYGNFSHFQDLIAQSQFKEDWFYDSATSELVYRAQITVDTLSVDYVWGGDNQFTNIESLSQTEPICKIYPNPTTDYVTLKFNSVVNQTINIKVISAIGTVIYDKEIDLAPSSKNIIRTSNWQAGMYSVIIENEGKRYWKKLIKL